MTSLYISMMLNIGSLVLGLGSWVFAVVAIITPRACESHKKTVVSFVLCVISLLCQLIEISNRAGIGDYAAIEDTMRAVLIAAVVMIIITVVLNVVAAIKVEKKTVY